MNTLLNQNTHQQKLPHSETFASEVNNHLPKVIQQVNMCFKDESTTDEFLLRLLPAVAALMNHPSILWKGKKLRATVATLIVNEDKNRDILANAFLAPLFFTNDQYGTGLIPLRARNRNEVQEFLKIKRNNSLLVSRLKGLNKRNLSRVLRKSLVGGLKCNSSNENALSASLSENVWTKKVTMKELCNYLLVYKAESKCYSSLFVEDGSNGIDECTFIRLRDILRKLQRKITYNPGLFAGDFYINKIGDYILEKTHEKWKEQYGIKNSLLIKSTIIHSLKLATILTAIDNLYKRKVDTHVDPEYIQSALKIGETSIRHIIQND